MTDRDAVNDYLLKRGCGCGAHASQAEHDRACTAIATNATDDEQLYGRVVEQSVLRAMFPNPLRRRAFLQAVGALSLIHI